jgi:NAD(P)-dependent dehydrogenase (short-subunit alcohol dehydrogenase family)
MDTSTVTTILSRRLPAKRAFITGAASGLARAAATELAGDGWHLGVLDRSAEGLREVETVLRAAGGRVDFLMNNAGVVWGCRAALPVIALSETLAAGVPARVAAEALFPGVVRQAGREAARDGAGVGGSTARMNRV